MGLPEYVPIIAVLTVVFGVIAGTFGPQIATNIGIFNSATNIQGNDMVEAENLYNMIKEYLRNDNYKDALELSEDYLSKYEDSDFEFEEEVKYYKFYSLYLLNEQDKAFNFLVKYVEEIKKNNEDGWDEFYGKLDGVNEKLYEIIFKRSDLTITDKQFFDNFDNFQGKIILFPFVSNYEFEIGFTNSIVFKLYIYFFGCDGLNSDASNQYLLDNYFTNDINRNEFFKLDSDVESSCKITLDKSVINYLKIKYPMFICSSNSEAELQTAYDYLLNLVKPENILSGYKDELKFNMYCCDNKNLNIVIPKGVLTPAGYYSTGNIDVIDLCSLKQGVSDIKKELSSSDQGYSENIMKLLNSICDNQYTFEQSKELYYFLKEINYESKRPDCCDTATTSELVFEETQNSKKSYDYCAQKENTYSIISLGN